MAKKVWQRMAIISAGVIMNVLTAVLFFAAAFQIGVQQSPPVLGTVYTGMPAWEAGLQTGDEIVEINGRTIRTYEDIVIGVALSSGPLQLEVEKWHGGHQSLTIVPDVSGDRRRIGALPSMGLRVPDHRDVTEDMIVSQGSGAANAEPPFQKGDFIRKIGDTEVSSYPELKYLLARQPDKELDFYVQRKEAENGQLTKLKVPPTPFVELGLVMDIGAVKAIKQDSPAERAGLQIGDKIILVNGDEVGREIDPLELPGKLYELAGDNVELYVRREASGDTQDAAAEAAEPESEESEAKKGLVRIELVPEEVPPWTELPLEQDDPLSASSIGAAFEITRTVLRVKEGSPAEKGEIKPGDRVQAIEFVPPDGHTDETRKRNTILFADAEHRDRPTDWASPFWMLQSLRDHEVILTVSSGGETEKVKLQPKVLPGSEWYMPIRGVHLELKTVEVQSDSFGEAISMGIGRTRNKILELYLTLRSLVRGDLSYRNLQGPVGIAKMAYAIARNGIGDLLMFLGFLSVNLAVLNFLPIPVLDGGHMVFLMWEGITGKKPSEKVIAMATWIGLMFILTMIVLVMYLDIVVRIFGYGEQ
jgi:regulator of sigma E protease